MQAVNLHKKLFYYLDPYGPSRGVRSVYTALVLVHVVLNFTIPTCMTELYYRKYFKMRFESLGKDKVNIEGCKFVQLNRRVQTDGCSCGIYCLKVCI